MLAGGQRHSVGQTCCAGVIHAHQPLKLGEFPDHGRAQVSLRKVGGLFGKVGIRADERGDFAGKGCDPGDPVGLAPQLVVEGHRFEAIKPLTHRFGFGARLRHPQVIVIEEPRIRQAGGENLLVALQDRRAMVARLGVGDGHEGLNPAGFRVFHREELLVFLHRGLQNLGRQVQEVIRDAAHQGHWPFDKARNLGQKAFVFHQFKTGGEGEVLRALPDRGLTLG